MPVITPGGHIHLEPGRVAHARVLDAAGHG